jgi:hypothetical protein
LGNNLVVFNRIPELLPIRRSHARQSQVSSPSATRNLGHQAQIDAVEGHAGREHTDPQLLISLWLYAYSRGISSARELARQCD